MAHCTVKVCLSERENDGDFFQFQRTLGDFADCEIGKCVPSSALSRELFTLILNRRHGGNIVTKKRGDSCTTDLQSIYN